MGYSGYALGWLANLATSAIQRKWNNDDADRNMARQMAMWEQTQSPQSMVNNLEDAGLNVGLMYGKGGAGGGNVPNAQGVQTTLQGIDPSSLAQMELLKAQTENIKQDTKNKEALTGNIFADTAAKLANAGHAEASTKLLEVEKDIKAIELEIKSDTKEESKDLIRQNLLNAIQNYQLFFEQITSLNIQNQIDIATMETKIKTATKEYLKLCAEIDLLKEQKNLTKEQISYYSDMVDIAFREVAVAEGNFEVVKEKIKNDLTIALKKLGIQKAETISNIVNNSVNTIADVVFGAMTGGATKVVKEIFRKDEKGNHYRSTETYNDYSAIWSN